ncbi:hypothetical protein OKW96_15850 [Sphingobacterium sp. KU25419]|nr:hypothetical protein OKW96_15850 [Sphingobacterium sp. KU25419]
MKNLEPFGLIQQRKPTGNFIADFNAQTDFIVVKIDNKPYTISNKALATLIMDVSIMSSIPHGMPTSVIIKMDKRFILMLLLY